MRDMRSFFGLPILAALFAACSTTPATRPSGVELFGAHCASCHGPVGEGDGPVAAALRVTVPNLRTLSERSGGVFPTDAVASFVDGRRPPAVHGDRYMPVWGEIFGGERDIRIEALLVYLRELQYAR